ncbi:MAG: hypothetical protein KDA32_05410 [Phycisphaerales bacterium]|nr:hypothetical protein [Phycisphaerales bacterium]
MTRYERDNLMDDLSAYLDGELDAHRGAEIERALVADGELREALDQLRAISTGLAELPRVSAPKNLVREVRESIDRPVRLGRLRWMTWASGATAAALLALVWLGAPPLVSVAERRAPMPTLGLPAQFETEKEIALRENRIDREGLASLGYVGGDDMMADGEDAGLDASSKRIAMAPAESAPMPTAPASVARQRVAGRGGGGGAEGLFEERRARNEVVERNEEQTAVAREVSQPARGLVAGGAAVAGSEMSTAPAPPPVASSPFQDANELAAPGDDAEVLVVTASTDEFRAVLARLRIDPSRAVTMPEDELGPMKKVGFLFADQAVDADELESDYGDSVTFDLDMTSDAMGRLLVDLGEVAPGATIAVEARAGRRDDFEPIAGQWVASDDRYYDDKQGAEALTPSAPRAVDAARESATRLKADKSVPESKDRDVNADRPAPPARKTQWEGEAAHLARGWLAAQREMISTVIRWYGGPSGAPSQRVRVTVVSPGAEPAASDGDDK